MNVGYKTLSIKVETYVKLKDLSTKTGKPITKILDELVENAESIINPNKEEFEDFVIKTIELVKKEIKEEIHKAFDTWVKSFAKELVKSILVEVLKEKV